MNVDLLKEKICWYIDDFANDETMQTWIDEAYQHSKKHDEPAYDVENFYGFLVVLHLIINVFQQANDQNLFLIDRTIA